MSNNASFSLIVFLPAAVVLAFALAAWPWIDSARARPLSAAKACALLSVDRVPARLLSRFDAPLNQMLIKAEVGRRFDPIYGLCILSGEKVDRPTTEEATEKLLNASKENCMNENIFYCKVESRSPGHCRSTDQRWRPPTSDEVQKRRRSGICAGLDRRSSWVQVELKRRYEHSRATEQEEAL